MSTSIPVLTMPSKLVKHNRAFKEWAVVCDALRKGEMIALLRKGGIREESGKFEVTDKEFFLLPTYEHQNANLLRPQYAERLSDHRHPAGGYNIVAVNTFAIVDTVFPLKRDSDLLHLRSEHVWNEEYESLRLNYNPYMTLST